jgi:hypothetical protein
MLNLIQHLTKSKTYETLKQVQGDRLGLFTRPSYLNYMKNNLNYPSPLAGEGRVRGNPNVHPHLNPPPSKGEESRSAIFMVRG